MISVQPAQCDRLARCLDPLAVRPDEFVVTAASPGERRREANLMFFLVAICQATRTLQGTVDGRWVRGWDYMIATARRAMAADPSFWTAERLQHIAPEALQAVFSDDGLPERSTLDRIDERVALLHDAAGVLLQDYGGDVMRLYEAAECRLEGPQGILARLAACQAYSDPVAKKSFLLVMFAVRSGAWQVEDLERLKVAVDYHIMRIALRSGMVEVQDPALARRLRNREVVSAEVDNAVREAVREACDRLVAASGQQVFDVDNILWMIGRNCCHYDHDPICGDNACWRMEACSLLQGIAYDCPGRCPLDGVCLGSRHADYRALWETTLYTHYY